jgi:hypothetical protein
MLRSAFKDTKRLLLKLRRSKGLVLLDCFGARQLRKERQVEKGAFVAVMNGVAPVGTSTNSKGGTYMEADSPAGHILRCAVGGCLYNANKVS